MGAASAGCTLSSTWHTILIDFVPKLLLLKQHEIEFVKQIRTREQIKSELITDNQKMIDVIQTHPISRIARGKDLMNMHEIPLPRCRSSSG